MEARLAQFIRQMPKVELHLHLEGSIRSTTLLDLVRRHRVTLPVNAEKAAVRTRIDAALANAAHEAGVDL
jgi:adenosine deaminase